MTKFEGEIIPIDGLRGSRSKELAAYLTAQHTPYLRLIECRKWNDGEFLFVEIDVEVAPRRPVPIEATEPLAIWCSPSNNKLPVVIAKRKEFPSEQLHITVDVNGDFASLCLWERSTDELLSTFTPFMFFSRIKEWLELAAEGKLHLDDQPLEPVLIGARVEAIFPVGPIDGKSRYLAQGQQGIDPPITIRFLKKTEGFEDGVQPEYVLLPLVTNVVFGRAVRAVPQSLEDLAKILLACGCDLQAEVQSWIMSVRNEGGLDQARPVIHVTFPKSKSVEGSVEGHDHWAFVLTQSVAEMGECLGVYIADSGTLVPKIGGEMDAGRFQEIPMEPMHVVQEIESKHLAIYSGTGETPTNSISIAAIGAGALGSRVTEICARSGFGRWAIFDKDIFLPHNAVRHLLGDWAIGLAKAPYVASFINQLVPGTPIEGGYLVDILDERTLGDEAREAFDSAELILDISASISVARKLSMREDASRCFSLFFNPSGRDLVFLAESMDRKITLIDLEASYYSFIIETDALIDHLGAISPETVRYGNGCRDISTRISSEQVSLLGGIGAKSIRSQSKNDCAEAMIWKSNEIGEVTAFRVPTSEFVASSKGDWTVRWSRALIAKLSRLRDSDLPNEAGGVLIGFVDFSLKVIAICSAIDAPKDSVKKPHYFERGKSGLGSELQRIDNMTAGQLRYIGEWHSHPTGVPATPSAKDETLFSRLGEAFAGTSEPHIMAIVGERELFWRMGINQSTFDHKISV